jgi:hypothetical protein
MLFTGINDFRKLLWPVSLAAITVVVVTGLLVVLLDVLAVEWWLLTNRWWLYILLTPLLLLGFHYRRSIARYGGEGVVVGLMLAVILVFGFKTFQLIAASVADPPEFDFQMYWLYGRAGVQGLNPYTPENLRQLAQPLDPSPELLAELYFFQLPPTLLLFIPLGWFNLHTAALLWYLSLGLTLMADVYLLWKIFLNSPNLSGLRTLAGPHLSGERQIFSSAAGLSGLGLTAALILMLPATLSTFFFGQVNFLVLLLLLLFWRDRNQKRSGLWLALGILVKPILIFLPLYLLLRRQWQAMIGLVVSLAVLALVTIVIFGPAMFFGYFIANPISHNMPDYLYTENINQSLLATVLRLTNHDLSQHGPLTQPVFVVLALILTGITAWLVFNLPEAHARYGLALTLALALLLFPKTLAHYSVLLIVPIVLLWQDRFQLGVVRVSLLVALTYALTSYHSGDFTFFALLLCWAALAGVGLWQIAVQPAGHKLPLPFKLYPLRK